MKFLYNAPAILYKKALILGDTHFGIESKLLTKGIYYSNFSDDLFEKIKSLIIETKAEKLILLGDVKEKIPILDRVTANIISKLSMLAEVIIVRGNHDGGIEGCGAKIIKSGGFVYGKLALVHGHAFPSKECMRADYLISCHQHPQLSIIDRSGKRHSEPVWIFSEADSENIIKKYKEFNSKIKLILMPAFNPLVGATFNPLNSRLGPILSNNLFKINDASIYRLEGTQLGKLNDLIKS
jgi:putative SbcD/Mre11-related phosphoesterase